MANAFTAVFLLVLIASVVMRVWLAWRQIRYVAAHAHAVPPRFSARIGLEAHRKAAAYTVAKQKLALVDVALGTLFVLALTVGGGLQALAEVLEGELGRGFAFQVAIVGAVVLFSALLDLPLSWYRQFHLEQRFGFNRMTPALFVADLAKATLLAVIFGLPLLSVVLWLMQQAGDAWWVYAWLVWIGFNALLLFLFPTVIAPLFNRFEPLRDEQLAKRIQHLLTRTGFASRGVFVMDGSRRSSHGNAYFSGLGRAKRIVFFDTLLQRLAPAEIEAVLAHELGHFKQRHIVQRLALSSLASLLGLALLGWLSAQPWFYTGLGVIPVAESRNDGLALALFFLVLPAFTFFLAPLASMLSRRHEFEADAFAAREASATDLASALVKLYEDNASTLTPDPLYSLFYDSHPPASQRIERLLAASA
ncbi:MAG: M48 family metallopeptidase [Sutterellaceae bacterium]|nr:M48 family metallopeptidase [Burkholderiaceae bacterium]MCX7901008.1 M48 family metallopeptidase [Burkholderiaceae bacterium]MDW8430366.1 M48 family metallopeptidase [Sutterellaceae bacterium]